MIFLHIGNRDISESVTSYSITSSIFESYILDSDTFEFSEITDGLAIYKLNWSNVFRTMHDLKELSSSMIEDSVSIYDISKALAEDDLASINRFFYKTVQNPELYQQGFPLVAEIEIDDIEDIL